MKYKRTRKTYSMPQDILDFFKKKVKKGHVTEFICDRIRESEEFKKFNTDDK